MKVNRLWVGVAAAALLAVPGVAVAAPADQSDFEFHVNVGALTAAESGGLTTVTFKPGAVNAGSQCIGPLVVKGKVTQEDVEVPQPGEGEEPPVAVGVDSYVMPNGIVQAVQVMGADFYAMYQSVSESQKRTFEFLVNMNVGIVGEHPNGELDLSKLPSTIKRNADSNAFGYTLDADEPYTAMGFCSKNVEDENGESTTEDVHYYLRTINHSADSTDPGGDNPGGDNSGGGNSGGGTGSAGSLGSLDLFGSLTGSAS